MANKMRSIQTDLWKDPWVEELSPQEKLLWIYLLTNNSTNLLGAYEITVRRICFETGLQKETVLKALEHFERVGKAYLVKCHVIITNFLKNQKMNPNMWKSAITSYNNLPYKVKKKYKRKALKPFERLLKASKDFEKYEVEAKAKEEIETKDEKENKEKDKKEACEKSKDFSLVSGKNKQNHSSDLETKEEIVNENKFTKEDYYLSKEFLKYQKNEYPKLVNNKKKQIVKGADTIRLLREQDDFTQEEIADTLRFALKDEFWKDKVLSVANIRKRSKNGNTKFQNIYRKFKNKPKSKTEQIMDMDISGGEEFWKM